MHSIISNTESSGMETSAPWLPEEKWKAGDAGSFYGDGAHKNNDYYCVDFNLGTGDNDKGSPILAVADGKVTTAHLWNGDKTTDPLGNYVRINHDTYESQYAHLDKLAVVGEQSVKKGQVIGYNGSTGNSSSPHLHFCLYQNGKSVEPNPMDGQTMADESLITSKNTNLFDKTYNHFGGSLIGDKEGPLHWYYGWKNTNLYDSDRNNVSNNIYIQDLTGGNYWDGATVYDALGGARKAYLIRSGFWRFWSENSWGQEHGGPRSKLGAPITDEYEYPTGSGKTRQDFQRGYLLYDQTKKPAIKDELQIMPAGMYVDGWQPKTSYAFAEAYERNGAAINFGLPDNRYGENQFVHNWTVNSSTVLIQDFYGGKWGDVAIIYNSDDNNAYVVRTEFWEYYRTNHGINLLGMPLEDEKWGVWNSIQCVPSDRKEQRFKKGTLLWDPNQGFNIIPPQEESTLQITNLSLARFSAGDMCTVDISMSQQLPLMKPPPRAPFLY